MQPSSRWHHPLTVAILLGLAVLAVYAPALGSYFVIDDFGFLAMSRLLDNPLLPFIQDHIPGSPFYRPLAMAFWWATVALFDNAPFGHYLCNALLHAASAWALWRLLLHITESPGIACCAALLFAVHPVGIGTSLWLSDRFDLLTTLFALLALDAAWRYWVLGRGRAGLATALLVLAAVLSKETGLAIAAPIGLLWIWPRASAPAFWSGPRKALLGLVLLLGAWLAWRNRVLQGPGEALLMADTTIFHVVLEGFGVWAQSAAEFFGFWSRSSAISRLLMCVAALGLSMLLVHALLRARGPRLSAGTALHVAIAVAAALLLAPGVVQSPVTRATVIDIGTTGSVYPAVFGARFYYLALAGLVALLALIVARVLSARGGTSKAGWIAQACLLLLSLSMAHTSFTLARQFREESTGLKPLLAAMTTAVEGLELPARNCQVYLLDVPDQAQALLAFTDVAVKALAPNIDRVGHCLFQGERTPWFHVVRRGSSAGADFRPMVRLIDAGKPVDLLSIGGMDVLGLNLFEGTALSELQMAQFLAYRVSAFVDVSADVRSGRREVAFYCARGPSQCACPGSSCPDR